MYERFFGLNEKPFSITPDPRYLYLTKRHAEALAHLLYGVTESGGFVQLTGEVGTGKTTLVRSLLEKIPRDVEVALILNPRLSPNEFLHAICDEVGADTPAQASPKQMVDALNQHLLDAHGRGRRVVLIVDEAQNLSVEVLEQIRLLTNLETAKQKLLQIILIGQPELRDLLARNDLRQLAQRITGRYHLDPLHRDETAAYVRHRLQVAAASAEIMAPSALRELHRISGGVPRTINVIGDRAMLGAYTREQGSVSAGLVREAASEVYGHKIRSRWTPALGGILALLAMALIATGAWQGYSVWRDNALAASDAGGAAPQTASPGQALVPGQAAPPPVDAGGTTVPDTGPAERLAAEASAPTAHAATSPADAATPSEPPPVSLAQLMATQADQGGTDSAFSQLFALWQATYAPGPVSGCEQARKQGLECLYQRGSWRSVVTLDLPAILSLRDDAGRDFQAVLAGVDGERAQLLVGGERAPVSLLELSRYWDGEFLLLWRPLLDSQRPLAPGSRGGEVLRLRQMLDRVDGVTPQDPGPPVYDARLTDRVQAFQRQHRLDPDGIVGARTQIVLGSALGSGSSPRLDTPD